MKVDDYNQTECQPGPEMGSSPEEPVANTAGSITEDSANSRALAGTVNEAKTTSSRKAKANRQNSKHSTGPKTRQGKDKSRRNAIKHGFFSKFLLVNGEESREEYEQWFAAIRDHYQPVN